MQGVLVSFGGYTWEVVYIQDNVITLYACDSVATMVFDAQDLDYAKSNVRAYLNDEFYPQLLKNYAINTLLLKITWRLMKHQY